MGYVSTGDRNPPTSLTDAQTDANRWTSSTDMTSFVHIVNPFIPKPGTEHEAALSLTFESLQQAIAVAASHPQLSVTVHAVVVPGEEAAARPPVSSIRYIHRTIQDLRPLRPYRPLPLIRDVLASGAARVNPDYLIFTNADIAVVPGFYVRLAELADGPLGRGVPFSVYRRNIFERPRDAMDAARLAESPRATVGYGYDCFVFPAKLLPELDLGDSCIGSAHFDYLFAMALDLASGFRFKRVTDEVLTVHLGNGLEWSQQMDYIEHNLAEAVAAIDRMKQMRDIPADSLFASMECAFRRRHARWDSRIVRKLKRLPLFGRALLTAKRALGRGH